MKEKDIIWDPDKYKPKDYVNIEVQPKIWDPALPLVNQTWDPVSRKLLSVSS